jgi:hypothetical protein
MEITDNKGWAAIRLTGAICNREKEKLSQLSEYLVAYYDGKEIAEIWRRVRLLLTEGDISWLEATLTELAQLQLAS